MKGENSMPKVKEYLFYMVGIILSCCFMTFCIPILLFIGLSYLFSHFIHIKKGRGYERSIEIK